MFVTEEKISKAGDYTIDELFLTPADGSSIPLQPFMLEINLYEDIFSPVLFGNIIISDSTNLISRAPILGNELITMKIRTNTLEDNNSNVIEKTFQIYAIEDRKLISDRQAGYKLSFTSREGYIDNINAISKTFRGTTSDIVEDIFTQYIETPRKVDSDKTTGLVITDSPHRSSVTFTANFWGSFQCMNFLAKRSKGNTLNSTDFLFYESNKNFYFTSLESLISNQIEHGIFDDYVMEPEGANFPRRSFPFDYVGNKLPNGFTNLEKCAIPKTLDIMEDADNGYLAGAGFSYDVVTKQYEEKTFDARKQFPNFVRTGEGVPIPEGVARNPYKFKEFFPLNSALYNDYNLDALTVDNKLIRQSYLNSINNFKFELTFPGRTDIEVGRVINLVYPSPEEKAKDEDTPGTQAGVDYDRFLSGPLLLTALHHKLDSQGYVIIADGVKNGLAQSLGLEGVNEEEVDGYEFI